MFIFVFPVFIAVTFMYFVSKVLSKYDLSLHAENKKFKYTLLIVQENGVEQVTYFYSDCERYTVDNLMEHLWDETLNAYVLKEKAFRKILCPLSKLYYCESFVERNEEK